MTVRTFLNYVARFFFVPKCVACGERLPVLHADGVLCSECRGRYETEKEATCTVCSTRLSDCLCFPTHLPRCRVRRMVKLVYYLPASGDVSASLIFALKHRRLIELHRFLAKELAYPLAAVVKERENWLIAYPPRSRAAIARDGFDHTACLARTLGQQLGIPAQKALVRTPGRHKQQKTRSKSERQAAAKMEYHIHTRADVRGRSVVLLDDVCTSGATLAACARLLYAAGAREVVFAVIAMTASRK